MSIPKWIPLQYRELMISFRPATDKDDPDDLFLLSQEQKESAFAKQMIGDKSRAVKNIAQKIHNKKVFIKQAKGKGNIQQMLKEQLEDLEQEQFQLLRDEILSACKFGGLLDEKKLRKVPGSEVYFKNKNKNKNKNKKELKNV